MHGSVCTDEHVGTTTWQGTWLASDKGLPSLAAFRASKNEFSLSTPDFHATGVPLEVRSPIGRSATFTGRYTLSEADADEDDDESGEEPKQWFTDYEHRIVVMDHSSDCSLVAERGTSKAGEYLSFGRLLFAGASGDDSGEPTLTVARRYLASDDARVNLQAWQALFRIAGRVDRSCRERSDFAPHAPAPWKMCDDLVTGGQGTAAGW